MLSEANWGYKPFPTQYRILLQTHIFSFGWIHDEFYLDGSRLHPPVWSHDARRKSNPVAASPSLWSASLSLETLPAPPGPPAEGAGNSSPIPHLPQLGCQKLCVPLTGFWVNTQRGQKAKGDKGEGSYGAWERMLPPPNWCIYQSQCR